MTITVGVTLGSSKLAVTQNDLHLVGSSVDQLVVRFDQAAFDKLLASDRVKANKARKNHHEARATAARLIAAASRSYVSLPPQRRRAASSPSDRPISASVRPHIYPPRERRKSPGVSPILDAATTAWSAAPDDKRLRQR